jgi:dCMP deaminase
MRPHRDEIVMEIAHSVARRSTCERALAQNGVGAVVTIDGRIISTGYAGPPSKMPHCEEAKCDLSQPCARTVHAEANAIAFAARHGVATEGATLYCTHGPCRDCAGLIINAGIKTVIYETPYRLQDGVELLEAAGVLVCRTVLGVAIPLGL